VAKKPKPDPLEPLEQRELLPLEHRSLQQDRLRNFGHVNGDAIAAGEWIRINKQIPNLLGLLLAPSNGRRDRWTKQLYPVVVSRRDAAVAASIVQWLGTAVGSSFARRILTKIDEACTKSTEIGVRRAVERSRHRDPLPSIERKKKQLADVRSRLAKSAKGGT
jgi:hypothetical protein